MKKLSLISLACLLTVSFASFATIPNERLISQKTWAPKGMNIKVDNIDNKQLQKFLATKKQSDEATQEVLLISFIQNGKGKAGETTEIVSQVGAEIKNNSIFLKTYYIESEICTDFIFPENCAKHIDYVSLLPNTSLGIGKQIMVQYKFTSPGQHTPIITTIIGDGNIDSSSIKFTSASVGNLIIE